MWWVVYYLLLQLGLSELWDEFLAKGCKHHVLFLKPICITRNIAAVSRSPATRVFFRQLWGHSNLAFTRGKYRLASRYQLSTWHRTVSLKFLSSKKKKKKNHNNPPGTPWNYLWRNFCVPRVICVWWMVYPLQPQLGLNIHWKGGCWSWSSNTMATWCKQPTHWKRPWCWERLRARGGEGDRG